MEFFRGITLHKTVPVIYTIYYCCCLVAKKCLALCDPMDCSPPGSSVHGKKTGVGSHHLPQGIFQIQPLSPALVGRFFATEPPEKSLYKLFFFNETME